MAEPPVADDTRMEPPVAADHVSGAELPGELLQGRYRIEDVLGEGALGRTYRAHDIEEDRPVAIKELLPARLKTWKDHELFEREAAMLQSLRHPGIPTYLDHFERVEGDRPRLFLVQEFIDGGTLSASLPSGPCSEDEVRIIAREVLNILTYLHALSPPVIHRDIKPDNLMHRNDGTIVLIDFGAVREVLDASDTEGSTMVGTFGYMPPEQYAGQAFPQSDLFALGATCIHLLTTDPPDHHFEKLFHIEIPADLPISVGFRRWIDRMIHPDLDQRFASAEEALNDLDTAFLMHALPRQALLLPPDPGPAPRPLPGFHYRDPASGRSWVFSIVLTCLLSLLSLPAAVVGWTAGNPGVGILAGFIFLCVATIAIARVIAARDAMRVYRHHGYTLGEVVRAWSDGGIEYRYLVDGVYHHGSIRSSAKRLEPLCATDPIGVLYDLSSPHVSRPFAG
ncbi:MAG: serine/threonine protein kinase [Deltaproteobacteria bacterium]|nr:MAG: serine/threonine protein kinase [Deltaproteobacteria bacterium]